MRLCDVGAAIQEVMESYEVEINGKVYQGMTSVASVCVCVLSIMERVSIIHSVYDATVII